MFISVSFLKLCFLVIIWVLIRIFILFWCMLLKVFWVEFFRWVELVLICNMCVLGKIVFNFFFICWVLCFSGCRLMLL